MNYDAVAPWYDRLASLVYLGRIEQSQKAFIHLIPSGSTVLIIGGGTGRFLKEVIKQRPERIVYVEKSEEMLCRAQAQNLRHQASITWIQGDERDIPSVTEFDAVLTFYLFSNYDKPAARRLWSKLHFHLKRGGMWINADFIGTSRQNMWQRFLTKVMLWFFHLTAKLKNRSIPHTHSLFTKNEYREADRKVYYRRFIEAIAYRKP
ncbi:MAG: class I SAM-dependent methyltransferase [Cyclobacteriaceae bacterium]